MKKNMIFKKKKYWRYIILFLIILILSSFYFQTKEFKVNNSWTITNEFKEEYISNSIYIDNWFVVLYDEECIENKFCDLNKIHQELFQKYNLNKYWITYINTNNKYFDKFIKNNNLNKNISFPFLLIHKNVFQDYNNKLLTIKWNSDLLKYKLNFFQFKPEYWNYFWYSLWNWKLWLKNTCWYNDYLISEECSTISIFQNDDSNVEKTIQKIKKVFNNWFYISKNERLKEIEWKEDWLLLSTKNKNILNLFISNFNFEKITNEQYYFKLDDILNSHFFDIEINQVTELNQKEEKNKLDVYIKIWDEYSNSLLYEINKFSKKYKNYLISIYFYIDDKNLNLEQTIYNYCIYKTYWIQEFLKNYENYYLEKKENNINKKNIKFSSCIHSKIVKDELLVNSDKILDIWNKIIPFMILNNKYLINWWIDDIINEIKKIN